MEQTVAPKRGAMTEAKQLDPPLVFGSADGLGVTRFAPSVVVDGRTVQPEGWMWVLSFALAGVPWAVETASTDEFRDRCRAGLKAMRDREAESEIAHLERWNKRPNVGANRTAFGGPVERPVGPLLNTDLLADNCRLACENERLRAALAELAALVRGECPSLLNEDSGGDARLDMAIDDCLPPNV